MQTHVHVAMSGVWHKETSTFTSIASRLYYTDDCWAQVNWNSPKNFVHCDSCLGLGTS